MWILAISRPYYPSVEEFATEDEAKQAMDSFLAEDHSDDGKHKAVAFVAEVTSRQVARTHY